MTKRKAVNAFLKECEMEELLCVAQSLRFWNGEFDEFQWLPMEDLDTYLDGEYPSEVLRKAADGNFNLRDDFFRFDDAENLVSCTERELYLRLEGMLDVFTHALLEEEHGMIFVPLLQKILEAPDDSFFDEEFNLVK